MSSTTLRRSLVLFIVALVISASSSQAAGTGWQQLAGELGRAAWTWLDSTALGHPWAAEPIMPKHGCSIDPMGKPICEPVAPKRSCGIDPAGKPICEPITPKKGCGIDPAGKPICEP